MFKQIPNWPDYSIDTEGNVYSHRRNICLKPALNSSGYPQVVLCRDTYRKSCAIHRLVALTHLPNPDGLAEVDHIDDNKENPHITNLQWLTQVANKVKARAKHYKIHAPDGVEYVVYNLTEFCRTFELNRKSMNRMLLGQRSHYKQWTGYAL